MPSGTDVTGSIPDIISAIKVIADVNLAQEGIKYNLHHFIVQREAAKSESQGAKPVKGNKASPASLSSPSNKKGNSLATIKKDNNKLLVTKYPILELTASSEVGQSVVEFCVVRHQLNENNFIFFISLQDQTGFTSWLFDQTEVEFGGEPIAEGYLIFFNGWINKTGPGFGRFSGSIKIEWRDDTRDKGPQPRAVEAYSVPSGKLGIRRNRWVYGFDIGL